MAKKLLTGLIGLAGLVLTVLAFFAAQLGVGHSSHWGAGRKIVAIVGILLLLTAFLILTWCWLRQVFIRIKGYIDSLRVTFLDLPVVRASARAVKSRFDSWKAAWDRWPPVRWSADHLQPLLRRAWARIRNLRAVRYFADSQDAMAGLAAVILGIGVILVYVWFVSVGQWTKWPKTTSYYQALADGFWNGQASLLTKPDPALLKLADPYELQNRQNIPYLWDIVLYNGKYYLYWGPVPALVVAAARLFYRSEIDDQVLVFAFVAGTFLFASLLLLRIRRRLFPRLPWPYIIPGILMAGFANPMPWLLNRPAVYEAAIAAGQFFLVAGVYFDFLALERPRPAFWKPVLAGACLALAVASRASLAPAAVFLVVLAAVWHIWRSEKGRDRIFRPAALLLSFAAGIAGLGWYNKIRFGSWTEFGFRYQLTGMNTHIQTFSPANLLINLHNYLLNPYKALSVFPFVKPNFGGIFIFFVVHSPANYYSEQVSGLIPTVPYLLLGAIPIFYLAWSAWQAVRHGFKIRTWMQIPAAEGFFQWQALTMSGAMLLAFAPILFFIAATMRYLGDAVPLLVIVSTFGFWLGARFLENRSALRGWFVVLVVALMVFSVTVSLLLAVTGYEARFEHLNPALFDQLGRFFNRW